MNILDRIDEIRANSVTPEEFEKAWGMNVDEYRQKIRAFSKEQDAELAAKKKQQSKRVIIVTRPAASPKKVVYGRSKNSMRAASSAIMSRNRAHNIGKYTLAGLAERKKAMMDAMKIIKARLEELTAQGLDLQTSRQEIMNELGITAVAGMKSGRQHVKKGKIDLSVINVSALEGKGIDLSRLDVGALGQMKLSGLESIGGSGGKASRRKGGKGPKGPRY